MLYLGIDQHRKQLSVNDYLIHLGLPATPDSPVTEYTYACINSYTVWGYTVPVDRMQSKSLADGLAAPTNGSNNYFNPTSVLQESYTYDVHAGSPTDDSNDTTYPVATDTVYANTDGTGAETTSHAYTWYPGTTQAETITTTQPVVSTAQHGSGVAATTVDWYDPNGTENWSELFSTKSKTPLLSPPTSTGETSVPPNADIAVCQRHGYA